MKIGIISAMQEEVESLVKSLKHPTITTSGKRSYYEGNLWGITTVLVFSRWGKVASSSTATNLILNFGVDIVLFTGVAGAIDRDLNIGDVVIGRNIYQHDMDSRPLYNRYEIPLTGVSYFSASEELNKMVSVSARKFLDTVITNSSILDEFQIKSPKFVIGDIASGDQFISDSKDVINIKNSLPSVKCVEMEGGAVAQVCSEYGVPFTIIRTISDTADQNSEIDFLKFIQSIASLYSEGIIKNFFSHYSQKKIKV